MQSMKQTWHAKQMKHYIFGILVIHKNHIESFSYKMDLQAFIVLLSLVLSTTNCQVVVLTRPATLISSSGSSTSVVKGSVIQIYCTVQDDTTVTFTWTHNGDPVLNDPPHIRIRQDNIPQRSASLITNDSTTVLTVDNFITSDNGVYQCTTASGANGTAVSLTAVSSTTNGVLMLTDQPSLNEPVDLFAILNDNRTGITLGDTVDGSLLTCTVGHQGDEMMNYPLPSVVWVRNGQVVDDTESRITITTSTPTTNGQVNISLAITDFGLTDVGVYQCVVTDDSDGGEVITSIPYQLDTGNIIRSERISPEVIILRPPEKLVIEVRVSGNYRLLFWLKGSSTTFIPNLMPPQELPKFHEIFVRDNTTVDDEGFYIVFPQLKSGTSSTHTIIPTGGLEFAVTPPVDANTTARSSSIVVIPEGGNADIFCRSVGAPVPSISWQLNNQTTGFQQTDTERPFEASLIETGDEKGFVVTPGKIESTLHIISASYPDHDGVYTCIGTNSGDLTVASSNVSITVQVSVIPEVEITVSHTLVSLGDNVTITCSVLRGNPSNYDYIITNTNTGSTTTGPILTLTDIMSTDLGTYRCDVTNDAGTGRSDNVTIELGELPDPPINVRVSDAGARWVVLCWTPSFDGSKPVIRFSLYISSEEDFNRFTLITTLSADGLMNSRGELMFNISMQGVINPYTNYSFTVDACSDIGCSNQSEPSSVIRTNEDASSPPTGLTAVSTQTTISLTWTVPNTPNGVITHYDVSFIGTRDYDTNFDDHTNTTRLEIEDVFAEVGRFEYSLEGLFPNTQYRVTVIPVNGAGRGMTDSVTINTLHAPVLIQLRLVGVDRCQQWVAEDGRQKLNTLSEALSVNIEERCQCGFSVSNILNPSFRCFPESENAVTYRTEVSSTVSTSPSQIVNHIEDWLTDGGLVTFDFITISIDSSCEVLLQSFTDPECNKAREFPVAIVGGAIGAVVVFVVITVNVVVVCILFHRQRTKSFQLAKNRTGIEMSGVNQTNSDTNDGEYETMDKFQDISTKPHEYEDLPSSTSPNPPPPVPEYEPVTAGTVVNKSNKNFDITGCAAYGLTDRH